jgi:hypothetical protein
MDDSDFTANELCCACGGGTADSTVEIRAPPSSAESDVAAREIANSISSLLANSLGLSEDELAAQKLFLVRGLAKTVSNAAITYGTSVLEFSAATQLQVIRVAAALTEVPVSEDELDLLLGAADTMFGASYTQFADDNVATIALDVTSSLLTVIQSSTDNTNTSQLKKRGQQVSRIVQSIAHSMAATVSLGATKVFASESISISVHANAAVNFESDSLGIDIELPDDMFDNASEELVSEVVRWTGAGPHLVGEMPSVENINVEEVKTSSNMLSVSFVKKQNLAKYDVQGLETPIVLSFPVQQSADSPWWVHRQHEDGTAAATVLCAYWNTSSEGWVDDGVALYNVTTGITSCKFTHLTDFVPLMGPPPLFNKIEFTSLADFWANNPTGFITSLGILVITITSCCFGQYHYKSVAKTVKMRDGEERNTYDRAASRFARKQVLMADSNVAWSKRAVIMLRTKWLFGASFCAYDGDSFLRSTRFFVLMVSLLVSMGLNVLFFMENTPTQTCEEFCEGDDPRNEVAYENMSSYSNATSCVETCEDEDVDSNNSLYSSLISAGIAIPVMGLLNFGFGWLRRPLNADMLTKAGVTLESLEEKDKDEEDRLKQDERIKVGKTRTIRCGGGGCFNSVSSHVEDEADTRHPCVRMLKLCCGWIIECPVDGARCMAVQCGCVRDAICPRRVIVPMSSIGNTTLAKKRAPRDKAQVGKRRANIGDQMQVHKAAAATLFARYDMDGSGYLGKEELKHLLIDLNNGSTVSDHVVDFVMVQAHIETNRQLGTNTAVDDRTTLQELKPAIALWKYLQFEEQWIDTRWDEFDTGLVLANRKV